MTTEAPPLTIAEQLERWLDVADLVIVFADGRVQYVEEEG